MSLLVAWLTLFEVEPDLGTKLLATPGWILVSVFLLLLTYAACCDEVDATPVWLTKTDFDKEEIKLPTDC